MNKSLRYIAILAIIPLFTAGLTTDYFTDADALKSKGTGTSKYGSSTNICGLQLCSEFPGGKAAWIEQQKIPTPVAPVTEETVELEEEIAMEETSEEETMMEESAGPTTVHVEIPVGTSVPGCEETNSCWSPADITINAGDTVHWMNLDTAAHTVTGGSPADGPSGVFDSSLVMVDATYEFTFDDAGSYDYFCMVHPWMVGSITVN